MTVITHYGLHYADGVAFLYQGHRPVNVYDPELGSPFQLAPKLKDCPHSIDITKRTTIVPYYSLFQHQVVRYLLPAPGFPQVAQLRLPDASYVPVLRQLQLLGSPATQDCLLTGADRFTRAGRVQLQLTNLLPLVAVVTGLDEYSAIEDLIHQALVSPRRLLICSLVDLPSNPLAVTLNSNLPQLAADISERTPLRELGAACLHEYMRGNHEHAIFQLETAA